MVSEVVKHAFAYLLDTVIVDKMQGRSEVAYINVIIRHSKHAVTPLPRTNSH